MFAASAVFLRLLGATLAHAHVIAVYIAHVTALLAFKDNKRAIRSQYPVLVLMVGYTMISL